VNLLGWHRDRKENPISAPSIHVGALVGAGSLWPSVSTYLVDNELVAGNKRKPL